MDAYRMMKGDDNQLTWPVRELQQFNFSIKSVIASNYTELAMQWSLYSLALMNVITGQSKRPSL